MIITIGAFLSEDGKIAVASLSTFIVSSVAFFIFGYFCHQCHRKQTVSAPTANTTPMYENVLPKQDPERDICMELQENVAYGPLPRSN